MVNKIDQLCVNTIRTLAMDAVQAADSGHPGTPMAIAGRWMAAHFNRPGFDLFDFDVYALAGDGCMMEGISGEAASLAGHLKLSNLCWIYDSNRITIEGRTDLAFTEDVTARISVEMAATLGWAKYVGPHGISIGMETFGASAPLRDLLKKFGFTVERIVASAKALLEK